jgi:TolB protein
VKYRILFLIAPAVFIGVSCDGSDPSKTLDPGQPNAAVGSGVGPHGAGAPASIVFYSARTGSNRIYLMNPDGSGQYVVSSGTGSHTWPDISPNGRFIAYTSNASGNNEITVLDVQRGTTQNVTNNSADDNWPRWSPSGQQLAFHSNRDGNYNIYVVNADGSGLRQITTSTLLDQWPDWSPDGKQLAFRRGQNVFVADADGEEKEVRQLTFNTAPTINQMAVWSPNGKELAFMSTRAGYPSVWVMTAEGETAVSAVNLTPKNPADASALWLSRAPAWSRDGKQIYFMSFRPSTNGDVELFVMQRDGSNVERLTNSQGEDGGPQAR